MPLDFSASPPLPENFPAVNINITPTSSNGHSRSRHQHSRSQQLSSPQSTLERRRRHHHHSLSIGSATGFFSGSSPSSPVPLPPKRPPTAISIEFDSDNVQQQAAAVVVVRPNEFVRGRVVLHADERLYVTRIRIKFYAEEVATVKLDDGSCHQVLTTFFESEHTLWGDPMKASIQSPWEELDVGDHEFPFNMKFPNVNYPPSISDPPGFAIHYVWTAHADGPAGQADINSRRFMTPYRPIIAATPGKEWVYRTVLMRDASHKKQAPLAQVQARLNKQCYCPDELLSIQLNTTLLQSNIKVTQVVCHFRQHHQGRLATQRGLATRLHTRELHNVTLVEPQSGENQAHSQSMTTVHIADFAVPTLNVSPTFASRHIRTTYDLLLQFICEESHFLKRTTTTQSELSIPVQLANLSNEELCRVPELASIEHYTKNKMVPTFQQEAITRTTTTESDLAVQSSSQQPPPAYYDSWCQEGPWEQRQERTVYMFTPFAGQTGSAGHIGCSSTSSSNSNANSARVSSSLPPSPRLSGQGGAGGVIPGCSTALGHHRKTTSLSNMTEALLLPHASSDDWA